MRAGRHDAAVGQHRDPVGQLHRARPVRDDQRRHLVQHAAQRALHLGFGVHVQRRQRVVQHQHRRLADHGPGQREPLPLPTGEGQALLADAGRQAPRQLLDELQRLRHPQRLDDLLVGHVRAAERHVLPHAGGEQHRLLERRRDHASAASASRTVRTSTPSIVTRPPRHVGQPRHQRGQRRLAAAGGADQRDRLAGPQLQVDAAQHLRALAAVAGEREPHVLEPHASRRRAARSAAGPAGR